MTDDELCALLRRARAKVPCTFYRHFKGNGYAVFVIALRESDLEPVVVYQRVKPLGPVWCRPLADFLAEVEVDGKRVPRFAPEDKSNG